MFRQGHCPDSPKSQHLSFFVPRFKWFYVVSGGWLCLEFALSNGEASECVRTRPPARQDFISWEIHLTSRDVKRQNACPKTAFKRTDVQPPGPVWAHTQLVSWLCTCTLDIRRWTSSLTQLKLQLCHNPTLTLGPFCTCSMCLVKKNINPLQSIHTES